MADMLSISNAAADAAGIPRLLLLACGIAEGSLNPDARRPLSAADDAAYWPDVSFGAWQQTVRWADEYNGGGTFPGEAEIERVGELYLDPLHAATVAAANLKGKYFPDEPDAIFRALCRYNFPGGHGQPASAPVAANYRNGVAQAQTMLGAAPVPAPTPQYNPDTPLILQTDDWSCWATSARMALESWGRRPTEGWIEGQLIADAIESTGQGLLDGSGAAGAAWLTRQYSDPAEGTPTITAHNASPVSFDDVKSVAGSTAVMLGGHSWGAEGHWTFVRRYEPATDSLELGNPAGVYAGISQVMSRQQFGQVAPCSMIVVTADGAVVPAPVPVPPSTDKDALIAQLQAENGFLRSEVVSLKADLGGANTKLGVASTDYVKGLRDLANAYEALKPA